MTTKETILQRFREEFPSNSDERLLDCSSRLESFLSQSLDELERKTREEEREILKDKLLLVAAQSSWESQMNYINKIISQLSSPKEEEPTNTNPISSKLVDTTPKDPSPATPRNDQEEKEEECGCVFCECHCKNPTSEDVNECAHFAHSRGCQHCKEGK